MKRIITIYLIVIIVISTFLITSESYAKGEYISSNNPNNTTSNNISTPVSIHGKLSVTGTNIVDKNNNKFQLRGVSTHGIQWFPQYVNQDAFIYMRDEWGINAIRIAMYSNKNDGYNTNLHEIVKKGINYAKNAGLYVIIDWHILNDGNPNTNKDSAINFFKEIANLYKDDINIIYEICNEPNGNVQWERDIKPYAEEVIKEIRNIDSDAIIVVGTPTWSQDVDIVAQSPINGYENIMYSLHFYAATHKENLRQKLEKALNGGLPIFVTEFGICDASGNGNLDIQEANIWIDYLNEQNISWISWNLSNKNESSAILRNTEKVTDWTYDELSESGKWILEALKRSNKNQEINDNTEGNSNNMSDNENNSNDIDLNENNNINNDKDSNIIDNKDNSKYIIKIIGIALIILILILIFTIYLRQKSKRKKTNRN